MSKGKSDSFIVTVDDTGEYNVVDSLELNAFKAQVDYDGSKQVVDEQFKAGITILEPKYNPYDLVQLLDLYTYHAACVDAVAVDTSGVDYTLKPVENMEPVDAEKELKLMRDIYDKKKFRFIHSNSR